MRLAGLHAFRAVMEGGTVTEAAKRLGRTQPQVSRILANLEQDLGFDLFARHRQRLLPTPEGRAFYREAVRILAGMDQIEEVAHDIRLQRDARLRILAPPHAAQWLLPSACARFAAEHPQIGYSLEVVTRRIVHEWVAGHQFDLGIVSSPIVHPAVQCLFFARVEVVAVVPKGHPYAQRTVLRPADLAHQNFIALKPYTLLRDYTERTLIRRNVPIVIRAETSTGYAACQLVSAGMGITLADPFTAGALNGRDVVIRRWRPRFDLRYAFLLPNDMKPSPVVQAFMRTVTDTAVSLAPDWVRAARG